MHTTHDITFYFLSKAAKQDDHNWEKVKSSSLTPFSKHSRQVCLYIHIYHVQYEGSHSYFVLSVFSLFFLPHVLSMSSASTPVIPFRKGIHDTRLIHARARKPLHAHTQIWMIAHTYTYIERPGGEVGCWVKEDKDNNQDARERWTFERKKN